MNHPSTKAAEIFDVGEVGCDERDAAGSYVELAIEFSRSFVVWKVESDFA